MPAKREGNDSFWHDGNEDRKRKRPFLVNSSSYQQQEGEEMEQDDDMMILDHPYNVRPSGNEWFSDGEAFGEHVLSREKGLGPWLAKLTDEYLLDFFAWLDPEDLLRLGCCSRLMFCYTSADELWKEIVLDRWKDKYLKPGVKFRKSWKWTFLGHDKLYDVMQNHVVLSDALFRPWQYATVSIKPQWLRRQVVATRKASELSVDDFVDQFESICQPVLIKDAVNDWNAFQRWGREVHGRRPRLEGLEGVKTAFRVGPVDMQLCDFLDYSESQFEENPLYLFDCKFVERIKTATGDAEPPYYVPKYFLNTPDHPDRDLFECMGETLRPDYRWLIAGAGKSGSKWHVDPNGTHAWNAIISGSKRWLMFPPRQPPPGVTPSEDLMDVTQPVSLMEWFVQFYDHEKAPIEFTAIAGDLVFVPSGWWHCVLNLEPCVAITQNYISKSNLRKTLRMMRDTPHLVSGIDRDRKTLYGDFRNALSRHHPELLAQAEEELDPKPRVEPATEEDKEFKFSFF